MRRLSYFIILIADGMYADPDGALLKLPLTGTRAFPNRSVLLEYVRAGHGKEAPR